MLFYVILAGLCSIVTGQLQSSNKLLIDTFAKISDNLLKNATDHDSKRASFTELLNFNQIFVETNDEPDKDNVFSYIHAYQVALNKTSDWDNALNNAAAIVAKNLKDYQDVIVDRVVFVDNNCTNISQADCIAKLKDFDSEKEKFCPDYTRKFAKLHYISLSHIQEIANLTDDYLYHSQFSSDFDAKKYLKDNILVNAYGLVPLSRNYQYLKLNSFECYY